MFLQWQELLAPFHITRFYTDGWGAYERHIDPAQHTIGKAHTQKIESKHINLRTRIKPTVSLDVISLVENSYGYYRGQIEQRVAQ